MVGQWFEEKNGHVRVYIRGASEWSRGSEYHIDQWVPAEIVERGALWRDDIKDWEFQMNFSPEALDRIGRYTAVGQPSSNTKVRETSRLARTIAGLLDEFVTNPAPFMGSKISTLLERRHLNGKGGDIGSVVETIIEGIKEAGLYDVLNRPKFTVQDIVDASTIKIDLQLAKRTVGGVYLRYHCSTSDVQFWRKDTKYVYVGKAVDFRDRFDQHPHTTSKYGELTRNSRFLISLALCKITEQDNLDFAYLVEQIFVCLLESYRESVLVNVGRTVVIDSDTAIRHAEETDAAFYFRQASDKVFQITGFPGAINRENFGVSFGANYSSPFKEWGLMTEQRLFLRHDTLVKSRLNGSVMPISIFRSAKPKIANYNSKKGKDGLEIPVFAKMHQGDYFFGVSHTQTIKDGTMGPKHRQPFYIVFEVRTDGQAHPNAWSRLPEIGPFLNWQQGRALAARMEWEYPIGSGNFRFRYIHSRKIFTFLDAKSYAGSNINYYRSIAMTQWLFNAEPNHAQAWMTRLTGCAYVLQTVYHYHTQTIEVKLPEPFVMADGRHIKPDEVMQQMMASGLRNVNGQFKCLGTTRLNCDTCALMRTERQKHLADGCYQVELKGRKDLLVCNVCLIFGRPCCSWTPGYGFKNPGYYTSNQIAGVGSNKAQVNADEVAANKRWMSLLVAQPRPVQEQTGEEFKQQLFDIATLKRDDDDLSDAEEGEDDPLGNEVEDIE
ncbi:hypothetical protein ACET3X_006480 [Alternaria dauci]|uniref:GIY-YIG domain-containing protein n=1 Tax=Alternaria dauci TaxID=48095 RepID=A0ABR3UE97_9PLEO